MSILVGWVSAMMGLGIAIPISKRATGGEAPPPGAGGTPIGLLLTLTYP